MTTDPIAAARALIEPLTGYTPKPWKQGQNNPDRVSKGGEYIANCNPTHQSHPRTENNARLMAAAPDLRDMVATLADALETVTAIREKVEADRDHLRSEVERLNQEAASYHDAYEQAKEGRDQALARLAEAHRDTVERCAEVLIDLGHVSESGKTLAKELRALPLDPDAEAALQRAVAEARLEGWRAGRDAAAQVAEDWFYDPQADEVTDARLSFEIRAMPEPKEASDD